MVKAGDPWVSCAFGNFLSTVLCAFMDKVFGLHKSMTSGQLITSSIHCNFMFAMGGFAETIDPPFIGHTFVYLKKNLLTSWFDPHLNNVEKMQFLWGQIFWRTSVMKKLFALQKYLVLPKNLPEIQKK